MQSLGITNQLLGLGGFRSFGVFPDFEHSLPFYWSTPCPFGLFTQGGGVRINIVYRRNSDNWPVSRGIHKRPHPKLYGAKIKPLEVDLPD